MSIIVDNWRLLTSFFTHPAGNTRVIGQLNFCRWLLVNLFGGQGFQTVIRVFAVLAILIFGFRDWL